MSFLVENAEFIEWQLTFSEFSLVIIVILKSYTRPSRKIKNNHLIAKNRKTFLLLGVM